MGFENFKKILGITAVGIGTAGAVEAQGPLNKANENDLASIDKNKIGNVKTGDETKIDFNKARKVSEEPKSNEGYTTVNKDGKKYFVKITDGKRGGSGTLGIANPDGPKGGKKYEDWIIAQLKNGTSPQELVDKKYISPEQISQYSQYYISPSVDVVYIEKESKVNEVDPYAAYAVVGNAVYHNGVSGHNTGQMYYLSMHSKNIQEGGMTDTGNEDFVIRLQDGNGKPILKDSKGNPVPEGLSVRIKAGDKNSIMNGAGRLLPGAYEKLIKLAEEQRELNKNKQEIQQIGPDFSTRADTVKL